MRVTAIPAQVTTVEDKIVGNLGFGQLLLLSAPVLGGGLLYSILPPVMEAAPYKLSLMALSVVLCGVSAIRIKGKIVLIWAGVLLRYYSRPRYYVFNKRSLCGREQFRATRSATEDETVRERRDIRSRMPLSPEILAEVKRQIENPAAHVAFKMRKGGMYVHITEIRQEG